MATTHTYSYACSPESGSGSISSNSTKNFVTRSGISTPAGETITHWRINCNQSGITLNIANVSTLNTWYTPVVNGTKALATMWTGEGKTAKFNLYNGSSSNKAVTNTFYIRTEELPRYAVTCKTSGSGTLTSNPTSAYKGQSVKLTPTPSSGYQFSSYTTSPSLTISSNKFTMPGQTVRVTATFTKRSYTVTVSPNNEDEGTITTGGGTNTWEYSSTHTITASPNPGYQFAYWKLESGYGSITNTSSASTTFTAGAGNAVINAYFSKLSYVVTVGSEDVTKGTVNGGGTFEFGTPTPIEATPISPYIFTSWTITPNNETTRNCLASSTSAQTVCTVPASDVTLTANFTADQSIIHYYDGTEFKPCTVWCYDDGSFHQCDTYYYDGTQWKLCSSTT